MELNIVFKLYFISAWIFIRNCHSQAISSIDDNYFCRLNTDLHGNIDNLFDTLKVNKTLRESPKTVDLLKIYNELRNYSTSNCDSSNGIEVASHVAINKNVVNTALNIDDEVTEVINLNMTNDDVSIVTLPETDNSIRSNDANIETKHFAHVSEMINALTIQHLANISTYPYFKYKPQVKKNYIDDIQIWRPPKQDDSNATRRIYNGKPASHTEYPFIGSIHIRGKFTCAGSAVTKELLLTAASCLHDIYKNWNYHKVLETFRVRLGSDYITQSGAVFSVSDAFFHPQYNQHNMKSNLAILKLCNVKTDTAGFEVQRVMLDRSYASLNGTEPKDTAGGFGEDHSKDEDRQKDNETESQNDTTKETVITVLGWGAKTTTNKLDANPLLASDDLRLFGIKRCQSIYTKEFVTDNNFCTGYIDAGGGACHYDAGGPGIMDGVLYGVVSFASADCGAPDSPTVFTKVGDYIEWIDSIVIAVASSPVNENPTADFTKPNHAKKTTNIKSHQMTFVAQVVRDLMKNNRSVLSDLLYEDIPRSGVNHENVLFNLGLVSTISPDYVPTVYQDQSLLHKALVTFENSYPPALRASEKPGTYLPEKTKSFYPEPIMTYFVNPLLRASYKDYESESEVEDSTIQTESDNYQTVEASSDDSDK